jgi:hypothetical protein
VGQGSTGHRQLSSQSDRNRDHSGGPGKYGLTRRWLIGVRLSELTSTVRLVAHTLGTWMDGDTGQGRPSLENITQGCRLSRPTVVGALKKLAEGGWIERSGGGGRGHATTYTARIPATIEPLIETTLGRKPVKEPDLFRAETGRPGDINRSSSPTETGQGGRPPALKEPRKSVETMFSEASSKAFPGGAFHRAAKSIGVEPVASSDPELNRKRTHEELVTRLQDPVERARALAMIAEDPRLGTTIGAALTEADARRKQIQSEKPLDVDVAPEEVMA